ncbi:MAG: PepSY domain-containing protein, partial [Chitinophagaceae bacterium]
MKVFFRRIHLYLSFAAGLVILIACLTGALLVFEKDLQMAFNKERYYTTPAAGVLPADTILSKVKAAYPGKVTGIKWYSDPARTVEVALSAPKKKEEGTKEVKPEKAAGKDAKAKPAEARAPGFTLFVDPYTGEVREKYSYRETGWYTVFALHRWLLGGEGSVGKYIVGVSTLLFLFILITGIVLWWPRTRKVLQQRLTIKWGASWKRLNHDLHLVLGFYSAILLFIVAFTGLAWSFEWMDKGIYQVTGSKKEAPKAPKSNFAAGAKAVPFSSILQAARTAQPDAQFYNVQAPKDSTGVFTVQVLQQHPKHESATDALYFDQYTAAPLGGLPYAQRSLGARVRSTFKPVHTGSIGGWPTKIIA